MDDKRSDRLEAKLDRVANDIGEINKTLAAQHVSLKEHIRRTHILEIKIAPLEKHVHMIGGVLKAVAILGILAGIAEGSVALLTYLKG